ncbi:MAG TPA: MM0924 family protein [Pyrinomonadaceae bacterium]|nr:MM0924 family protein [Pyrinomonadaceae bacterium]
MEELIKGMIGTKLDITCGTNAVYRGEVLGVSSGVVRLKDDDERTVYVSAEKISTVVEVSDSTHRPGFIA